MYLKASGVLKKQTKTFSNIMNLNYIIFNTYKEYEIEKKFIFK